MKKINFKIENSKQTKPYKNTEIITKRKLKKYTSDITQERKVSLFEKMPWYILIPIGISGFISMYFSIIKLINFMKNNPYHFQW
jgi:hypothetical protein